MKNKQRNEISKKIQMNFQKNEHVVHRHIFPLLWNYFHKFQFTFHASISENMCPIRLLQICRYQNDMSA